MSKELVEFAQVLAGIVTPILVLVTLVLQRKWKVEDREWQARSEKRGKESLKQTEALNEKADANMVVSTAAADASQTAVAVGVKAAAAASGEPEHKVLADVQTDLNRRLRGVFGLGGADASEAEEVRGNHGPR